MLKDEYFDSMNIKHHAIDSKTNISSQLDSTGILDKLKNGLLKITLIKYKYNK